MQMMLPVETVADAGADTPTMPAGHPAPGRGDFLAERGGGGAS